jgi:hypothetical protein
MIRPSFALLMACLLAAACTPAPAPSRAVASLRTACRSRSEAAYNRQNRDLLSTRDTTDTPFSTSGVSGITTTGLSREYDREVALDNCLKGGSSAGGGAGVAPSGDGSAFQGPVVQAPSLPTD